MSYETQEQIQELVNKQKEFYNSGVTLDIKWRKQQLIKLRQGLIDFEEKIEQALYEDLGRSAVEAYFCDIGAAILEINEYIHGLKKWAKPEKHFSGITCFPSTVTRVYKMPYGNVLIISPFNFPIMLSIGVLAAAIAGGNTAVIKTSSKSRACTKVTQELIHSIFGAEFVEVVDGGHDVADMCLETRFDKIFYTGSPRVGVHVLEEAAKNLTPCALELGGENGNWALVRKDADLKDAARKIAFFKLLNSGQICINVNQVAVAREVADEFVECLKAEYRRQIGDNAVENPEYPKLISKAAWKKCEDDTFKYKDRLVFGGYGDEQSQKYAPTIFYPVDINEEIVQKELFNPLLPIVVYDDDKVDEIIKTIESREHGLSFYLFTKNIRWARKVIAGMQFGGGCINEVVLHIMVKGVPFNGVGHSGMGAYHGEYGFIEFTHPKTVLEGKRHFNLSLREHPYTGKVKKQKMFLLRLLEK